MEYVRNMKKYAPLYMGRETEKFPSLQALRSRKFKKYEEIGRELEISKSRGHFPECDIIRACT